MSKLHPKMDSSSLDVTRSELWLCRMWTNPVIMSISVTFLSKFRVSFEACLLYETHPHPLATTPRFNSDLSKQWQRRERIGYVAHVWPIVSPLNPFATPLGSGGSSVTKLVDTDSFVPWKAPDRARNSFMICRPLNNTPIQPATLKLKDRRDRKIFLLHNDLFISIILLKIRTNLSLLIIPTLLQASSNLFQFVPPTSSLLISLSPILARLFCRVV